MIFQSDLCLLYIRIDVRHLVWRALRNIATDMAGVESFEEMVGTREATAVATESGGTMATESGGAVVTESGGAATTGDETVATAGNETAATGGIMYMNEGELEFDEDELAALEGQRLFPKFRCGIY